AVDPEPAGHLPPAHLHRARLRGRHELVGLGGIDADEEPALAAGRDGHVAADEEREPAEHLLLHHVGRCADRLPTPRRQPFVVRHRYPTRRSSSAVSSAVGTASSRSSGMGSPLCTDRPYVPAASLASARSTASSWSRRSSSRLWSSSSR